MKKLAPWLAALAILVVIFGSIYTVAQQLQRSSANNAPLQLAEHVKTLLDQGTHAPLIATGKFDMAKTFDPVVIIYDKNGKTVSGTGYINDKLPEVPISLLRAADHHLYSAVPWTPRADVRYTAVTVATDNYYVVGAQTLRLTEAQEALTFRLAFTGFFLSSMILAVCYMIVNGRRTKPNTSEKK